MTKRKTQFLFAKKYSLTGFELSGFFGILEENQFLRKNMKIIDNKFML
jgi:nitrogenase molybdenum-iron protein alpha/beta subunit